MTAAVLERPSSATALTSSAFTSPLGYAVSSSAGFFKGHTAGDGAYKVQHRTSAPPLWVEPTLLALVDIQSLPNNWDSYGAKATNIDLIRQSLSVLQEIMRMNSPPPFLVPLTDGGIQIEWHRKQQDLEIVFPADEAPHFYYSNRLTGEKTEGYGNQLFDLAQILSNLT